MRVLLVDDEPLALARLQQAFDQIPDAVVVGTAADGRQALARIDELAPDLVILDIRMPFIGGVEVALGLPPHARPEVIFVTAEPRYPVEAVAVDAAGYLWKPLHFDGLRTAVEVARARRVATRWGPDPF